MSRDINPFGLRMPPSLRATLEEAAQSSGRSLNSEIVHRLMQPPDSVTPEQAKRAAVLDALLEAVAEVRRWAEHVEADPESADCRRWFKEALEDLDMWHRRLLRLDSQP